MAKSAKRKAEQGKKARRRTAAYLSGGGQSKYAQRHRGGGNTRPGGMWLPAGFPGGVTREDLEAVERQKRQHPAERYLTA